MLHVGSLFGNNIKRQIMSLDLRMRKQLLWLMFVLSRDKTFLGVSNRVTRSAEKIVFKVPVKILPVYERFPYYIGTKLWNELSKDVQIVKDIHVFKREIDRMNRHYIKL